ncbi:MAG: tripartite tricarboxylate transporter permease [Bosea sp.]|uniref:tripartite tricarboxylate transporter permease n=1 Tax=Bosea sp. (in: a-proteobacteria) TaxID=1871050 RepID=UPI00239577B8|nr:tripartite tricarboxylate transporter permease [Bosea sp. (in: a-proteobacteria)]MCP4740271.1 tripartite tricarboxylate transporter permease [Bosea sp. (in: a-proteobacteria)]
MDLLGHLLLGLQVAITPTNLLFCFIGALLGTLVGVLPGIGPAATVALLLPITFTMSPETSLIMLAGIYYGAQYGGSTTAILINLPGEASSAVTAIDGYQMARQGRAGAALGIAAIGSFIAGSFATLVIAWFAEPLTTVALKFGPAEYFSLILLGLVASTALAHGSVLKALAMIVLGMLLGLVGTDVNSGQLRYTFGVGELADGLGIVAIAVGVFGIAEIFRNLEDEQEREVGVKTVSELMPSATDLRASAAPIARGTVIGTILGVLPGGGALLASFASYAIEKKLAKNPSRFGKGAIEGVAGPESANNAGAQTSFIPMLTLGLPANAVMALMVGAMTIQGIAPGPSVITDKPELFWGLIASMWIGNLMLVLLNLPLIGIWVRLLSVPYYILFPGIIAFSAIGVYSVASNVFDLYTLAAFGLIGYLLVKLGFELTPLLLGFVLGPMMETYLRRAMVLSRGDPSYLVTEPLSAALLAATAGLLCVLLLPSVTRKRSEVFVEED